MTTIVFIEKDQGFIPGHIKDIKKDNVYYLVVDGERGQIHHALCDAVEDSSVEDGWRIEGVLYE